MGYCYTSTMTKTGFGQNLLRTIFPGSGGTVGSHAGSSRLGDSRRGRISVRHHLGWGDALFCSAMVKKVAAEHEAVYLFMSEPFVESAAWLYQDTPNVAFIPVDGDLMADDIVRRLRARGMPVFELGFYGDGGEKAFLKEEWERDQYRQAGLDPELRWDFRCERDREIELKGPKGDWIFVHDDPARGYRIDPQRLPQGMEVVRPEGFGNFFRYWGVMEGAREVHLIDSCFLCFTELVGGFNGRLVWHRYARRGLPPKMRLNWEILE